MRVALAKCCLSSSSEIFLDGGLGLGADGHVVDVLDGGDLCEVFDAVRVLGELAQRDFELLVLGDHVQDLAVLEIAADLPVVDFLLELVDLVLLGLLVALHCVLVGGLQLQAQLFQVAVLRLLQRVDLVQQLLLFCLQLPDLRVLQLLDVRDVVVLVGLRLYRFCLLRRRSR